MSPENNPRSLPTLAVMPLPAAANLNDSATATAGNAAVATLAPQDEQIAHLSTVTVSAAPATLAEGDITIAGVIDGPLTVQFSNSVTEARVVHLEFPCPLRGSAKGVDIVVTCAAITGSALSVVATGYAE